MEKSITSKSKNNSVFDQALSVVEGSSYRLTQPRRHLLNLIVRQKGPFSAPQLVERIGADTDCDPVTIYRTLPIFEELGIIEKCDFSESMAFYEVSLGRDHHHHHIVCKQCRKVEPLDFCILQAQEQVLERLGYTALTHRLEFAGLCPKCS